MGDTTPAGGRVAEIFALSNLMDLAKNNLIPLALIAGGLFLVGGSKGRRR
jgi:hypothetical protein